MTSVPPPPPSPPARPSVSLATAVALAAIAAAGAFAAGRATSPSGPVASAEPTSGALAEPEPHVGGGNGAAPHMVGPGSLPPSHPAVDPATAPLSPSPDAPEVELVWTAPKRWTSAPNPSAMRLATYKVPHAPGDPVDAEVSISRAGGSVEDNANRWVGQFDDAARTKAKRTTRKAAGYDAIVVDVEGTFGGGMGGAPLEGAALAGAIVSTPGFALFVKITGPAKTVKSARAELDQLLDSLKPKG